MANSKQAIKRARQTEKRTLHNASQHSEARTFIKKTLKLVKDGDKKAAAETFQKTTSMIDRVARRGIIHKNKAARLKSRLSQKIKNIAN